MHRFILVKSGELGVSIMLKEIVWWQTKTSETTQVFLSNGNTVEVELSFDAFNKAVAAASQ